jgi:hypothetical protein
MELRMNPKQADLVDRYQMQATSSNKRMRRLGRIPVPMTVPSDGYMDFTTDIEEVRCCEILMPTDKLEEMLDTILEAEEHKYLYHKALTVCRTAEKESKLRSKDPRLQSAWNKYQTLLNLVRHDYD